MNLTDTNEMLNKIINPNYSDNANLSITDLSSFEDIRDFLLSLTSNISVENANDLSDFTNPPSNATNYYQVPTGIVILLSIFYGSISLIAVVGNALVMWVVATSRKMHSVTNYFIANLALADIIIGLFSIPFQFQAALLQRWDLPQFMCAFCPFFQTVSVNVSVFTLTAIAVDRYRAIVNPLNARPSKFRSKIAIVAIWLFSVFMAIPNAIALRVIFVEDEIYGGTKPFCDYVNLDRVIIRAYMHILVTIQYFLPLGILSFAYLRIGWQLWIAVIPGNAEDGRDAHLLKNKKRVIKMLFVVVTLFAICWAPLQTYYILQETYPEINNYQYINYIWFASHWLAMSNSCCNPFIYAIYNEKFKQEFRYRFRWFLRNNNTASNDFNRYRYQASFRSTKITATTGVSGNDAKTPLTRNQDRLRSITPPGKMYSNSESHSKTTIPLRSQAHLHPMYIPNKFSESSI